MGPRHRPQEVCEEDGIIMRLREMSGDEGEMYYDSEFGGESTQEEDVVWLRPQEICEDPEYFVEASTK